MGRSPGGTYFALKKGGTFAIHDIFSTGKYGDMQGFIKKLKEMGYEKVDLINTTNGKWIRKGETGWMGLSGSSLLAGSALCAFFAGLLLTGYKKK